MTTSSLEAPAWFRVETAHRAFWGLAAAHFVLWLAVAVLRAPNPPSDSLEGLVWGRMWLLDYGQHPFLAPWLTAFVTDLFGAVGWPIYLLSELAVVTCFWAVWRVGLQILPAWHAFVAVALLEGIPLYNIESDTFNPDVLMLPFWALVVLAFYRATQEDRLADWLAAGVFGGLAMLAKYESVLLFVTLALAMATTPQGRLRLRGPGPYAALATGVWLAAPNLYWIATHGFGPVHHALGEMAAADAGAAGAWTDHLREPASFLPDQLGRLAPLLILYTPFVAAERLDFWPVARSNLALLALVAGAPLALTLLFSLATGASLISRWSFPFFSFAGLLLVAWHRPVITPARLKQFLILLVALSGLFAAVDTVNLRVGPYFTGKASYSAYFPGQRVADYVTRAWHDRYGRPLPYVAGEHHTVVNVVAHAADRPLAYFEWDPVESPWIDEADVRRRGAAFVGSYRSEADRAAVRDAMVRRWGPLAGERVVKFQRLTGADVPPVEIWLAFLPPADARDGANP